MADVIARMLEMRGGDDETCQAILEGKSPQDRAADLIGETQLDSVDFRKSLVEGGKDAVMGSRDPMIMLAWLVDAEVRAEQKITDELDEMEKQAYSQIAEATFATQGTSTYPDATFTLRLSFGPVKGYEENGTSIPPMTDVDGAFMHEETHQGQQDFDLPESWHRNRSKIAGTTPFNFVCTADIIGGNSGSPVINKDLEPGRIDFRWQHPIADR